MPSDRCPPANPLALAALAPSDDAVALMRHRARLLMGVTGIDPRCAADVIGLNADIRALGEAALLEEFDEARFRAQRVTAGALRLRLDAIADAGFDIEVLLGPVGSDPFESYGMAFVRLAELLGGITLVGQ